MIYFKGGKGGSGKKNYWIIWNVEIFLEMKKGTKRERENDRKRIDLKKGIEGGEEKNGN